MARTSVWWLIPLGLGQAACADEGFPLTGSYDLTLRNVAGMAYSKYGHPVPTWFSEEAHARVDVREVSGEYQAIVTPRWGAPSAFAVALSSDDMTLTGSATVGNARTDFHGSSNEWISITLARNAEGKLTGAVGAAGEWITWSDDIGFGGSLVAGGTLVPDAVAPELKSAPSSPGGPLDALLPWDPVLVSVAEGVDEAALTSALSLAVSRDGAPPVAA